MIQSVFIPSERAGTLEVLVQQLAQLTTKRKRQAEFHSLARVAKGLKLIPHDSTVAYISCGVSKLGESGVVITLELAERAIVGPISGGESREPADRPWSEADDRQLLVLFDQGQLVEEICEATNRSQEKVRARLVGYGRLAAS